MRIEAGRRRHGQAYPAGRGARLRGPGSSRRASAAGDAALPLLDVVAGRRGQGLVGRALLRVRGGRRFRYAGHDGAPTARAWRELRVDLADPVTGLRAEVLYRVCRDRPGARSAPGYG